MRYNPEDSIKIAIADVAVGMFVTAIEHNKRVNLANAGRVSSAEGIKTSRKWREIRLVDQSLSAQQCVFKPVEEPIDIEVGDKTLSVSSKIQRAYRSREVQHKRAKKLIAEAKA